MLMVTGMVNDDDCGDWGMAKNGDCNGDGMENVKVAREW